MKILLTGANGQLGRCFQDIFPKGWELIATDSKKLDITDRRAVDSFVKLHQPDIIVNAAAYTAVDKAESESNLADKVNAQGPYHLALASHEIKARFYHISTDYVFDGNKSAPYKETDQTNPLSVYGKTKLKGEQLSLKANPSTIIIRTAWLFSEHGNNFVKTILKLANARNEIHIVNDQIGCPTYAGDLAEIILLDIRQNKLQYGIYHYSGNLSVSWYDFAKNIFDKSDVNKSIEIFPITTESYITLAKRPNNSTLDNSKIKSYGFLTSDWKVRLIHVINQLNEMSQNNIIN